MGDRGVDKSYFNLRAKEGHIKAITFNIKSYAQFIRDKEGTAWKKSPCKSRKESWMCFRNRLKVRNMETPARDKGGEVSWTRLMAVIKGLDIFFLCAIGSHSRILNRTTIWSSLHFTKITLPAVCKTDWRVTRREIKTH